MSFYMANFLDSGAIMSLSPDSFLIGWGVPKHISGEEIDFNKPAFYFPNFFLTNLQSWVQYSNWIRIPKDDFYDQLDESNYIKLSPCDWTIHQSKKFKQAFDELCQLIQVGQLQKGVPYLFAQSPNLMSKERLQLCLKSSLCSLKQGAGYLYGYWHMESGILGVTPELLFSHSSNDSRYVSTMALAGTCSSFHCQEDSFINNKKEQHEHRLVVQGIERSLQTLGVVKVGKMKFLKLPTLTHLMTPIDVKLNDLFDFDLLVRCLHPTPALGAFPLEEGKKWLQNFQEHTPRSYYGAPIGFRDFQKGLSKCFVGIRNVQWNKEGMRIGAGCGVVKQSIFDQEWQEIQLKIKAIRDLFHL